MKKNLVSRAWALTLALALVLSLTVLPVGAAAFPDIEDHWARENIEAMTALGMFTGYEDGSFRPENLMRTSEALAMCARVAAGAELRARMEQDWADELDALLGDELSWFRGEFAACLEFGILTYDELERIVQTGQDQVPMQKAEFAKYLTRAMGLGSLVEGLALGTVSDSIRQIYDDYASIPVSLQPYIYILTIHDVLQGAPRELEDGSVVKEIQPLSFLSRAVAATMIGRVLETAEILQISVELPRYTTYPFAAGFIADVSAAADGAAVVTVEGMDGTHTVTLAVDAVVYQNNMPAKRTDLKVGAYARLVLNTSGKADAVRLIAADRLTQDSGQINELSETELVLNYRSYAINRFTLFSAGGRSGGIEVVDWDAGYTSVECVADSQGNLLYVDLKGGTREAVGLLSGVEINSVTGAVSILMSGYDGRVQRYSVPTSAVVTSGGLPFTLRAGENTGAHITLRVANEDLTAVRTVELDLLSRYIQGSLDTVATSSGQVTITERPRERTGTYTVDPDCVITFNGAPSSLSAIKSGNYVTARFQGGQIMELSVWPGSVTTVGKLVSIDYAETTTLHVATESGVVEQFSIELADLSGIRITRGGADSSITYLTTGDTVSITVVFHKISRISATPQAADVTGVVSEISFSGSGASITLTLPDGTANVYTAAQGITVLQDGSVVPLNGIKPGMTLAAVTEGSRIISAVIKEAAQSSTKLVGTIYLRESTRRLNLMVTDETGGTRLVVVVIPDSVSTVSDTQEGTINLTRLQAGDKLEIWGAYNKQEFVATLIIRAH